jgi:hypothetical protein
VKALRSFSISSSQGQPNHALSQLVRSAKFDSGSATSMPVGDDTISDQPVFCARRDVVMPQSPENSSALMPTFFSMSAATSAWAWMKKSARSRTIAGLPS